MIPAWIGWLATAAIFIGFGWMFYRQRRKKATDERNHHIILLDGFPIVHIPVSRTRSDAESLAQALQGAYKLSWAQMGTLYGVDYRPAGIDVIGVSDGIVREDHKHVMWLVGRGKVFLSLQPTMVYWFVRELHNIFRYQLYGINHIYKPVGKQDSRTIASVESWIDKTYRSKND